MTKEQEKDIETLERAIEAIKNGGFLIRCEVEADVVTGYAWKQWKGKASQKVMRKLIIEDKNQGRGDE